MTISTTTSSVTYQGNGATTTFNFSFVGDSGSDLFVYYTDSSGTYLLDPAVYTVFISSPPVGGLWGIGGSVTYPISGAPIASGTLLSIVRGVPYTQNISISNQGAFYPQAVEQALDILELQIQQLVTDDLYALRCPVSDLTPPAVLPPAAQRANYVLGFDGTGQPVMVPNNDVVITVNTMTQPVLNLLGTPPVSPSTNDQYLVAHSGTTGAFVGHEDQLAVWNGTAWIFTTELLNTEILNLANSGVYHKVIGGWVLRQVYAVPGDNLQTRATAAAGNTLVFLPGTYTSVNIAFSSNTTVTSTGLVTLQTTSNTLPIWDFTSATDCVVRGRFVLQGNGANATIVNPTGITGLVNNGQVGIKTFNTLRLDIDGDIEIKNISGYGIDEHAPASAFTTPGANVFKGLRVHDCYFGAYVRDFSEYSTYLGCSFYKCVAGVKDEAGNRSYVDCNINTNTYGIFFDGTVEPGNNSHGIVSSCFINHNGFSGVIGANVTCDTTQLGMLFTGCQVLSDLSGSGHGLINILGGAKLINFVGCGLGSDVNIDATSQASFVGNTMRSTLMNAGPTVAAGGQVTGTGNVNELGATATLFNGTSSWTPGLQFGGASTGITYSFQNARYHYADGYLHFTGQLVLTSKGSATGVATVTGLPFVMGTVPNNALCQVSGALGASATQPVGFVQAGTSAIKIFNWSAGALTQMTDTFFTGTDTIYVSGFYPLG